MPHLGIALEPSQSLHAGRQGEAEKRQERSEKRNAEGAQHDAMGEWRQQAKAIQKRDDEEGGEDQEWPKQSLPDPLADKREKAQAHAPFKVAGEA